MRNIDYGLAFAILIILIALMFFGCEPKKSTPAPTPTAPMQVPKPEPSPKPEEDGEKLELGKSITLWATMYYKKVVESSTTGVPLRDMSGKVIGPKLANKVWCLAAIEGTVRVDGVTYNYAGRTGRSQADCGWKWRKSETIRWSVSKYKYGLGNRNNPLVPYVSLACDQSIYPFGQKIYIPAAKGVKLPNGETHSGVFRCDDVGGAIKGNHIDVFIGSVQNGLQGALELNPFKFIKSSSSATFEAFLVK
jgi:3D (Asp-Asp-Asp) domain-containing protein